MNLLIAGQCVNQVLGELSLSKTRSEAAATLCAVIRTGAADSYFPQLTLSLGDSVTLSDESGCLFTGGVQEIVRGPEAVTVTAYDRGIYLTRNELYGVFSGSGASIVAQVAGQLGISLGNVDAPGGYQVIVTASGESAFQILRRAVGEKQEIYMDGEKLCVGAKSGSPVELPADKLLEGQCVGSIRQMINRAVVLKRGTTAALAAAQNSGHIDAYGQFQVTRTLSQSSAQEQAQAALSGIQFSAEVTALGDLALRCGESVSIRQPQWGLDGTFLITGVRHRWSKGLFLSELSLESA